MAITRLGHVIRELVRRARQQPENSTLDSNCELCADVDWWKENGYSEAERLEFCEMFGCNPAG